MTLSGIIIENHLLTRAFIIGYPENGTLKIFLYTHKVDDAERSMPGETLNFNMTKKALACIRGTTAVLALKSNLGRPIDVRQRFDGDRGSIIIALHEVRN